MRKRRHSFARGLVISLAVFAALIFASTALFRGVSTASGEAQTELVRDAVKQAAITCFAIEGTFPSTLDYLKENYGLSYDEENYFVSYDAFASNILPVIRVTQRGSGE